MADREAGQDEGSSMESTVASESDRHWETVSFDVNASAAESDTQDQGVEADGSLAEGQFLAGMSAKAIPKRSGRRFGIRQVIGPDERTRVSDTGQKPFRWICSLTITPPQGNVNFVGTGWLISPRTVVTAGHCVYCTPWTDHRTGRTFGSGAAKAIRVAAGRNGGSSLATASAVKLFSVDEWMRSQDERFDFGAILLDKPIGSQVGFFGFAAATDAELEGPPAMKVNVAGYPGESPDRILMHPNKIVDATPTQLLYECDTTGGQSGSPVIHWDGSTQFTVVGIHNQGSPQVNFASRITTAALAKLREWKQAGM